MRPRGLLAAFHDALSTSERDSLGVGLTCPRPGEQAGIWGWGGQGQEV